MEGFFVNDCPEIKPDKSTALCKSSVNKHELFFNFLVPVFGGGEFLQADTSLNVPTHVTSEREEMLNCDYFSKTVTQL